MGNKRRKVNSKKRIRNNYVLGITSGVLIGLLFGLASDNLIPSLVVCGLLGFGMGYAINRTING
ncbi:MAG: hypothetical protein COA58_11115 [Bacteroidetes bacterium]|nr:MAG: hypothetical protein COA58_11115 [Bacteroidota bacterium]